MSESWRYTLSAFGAFAAIGLGVWVFGLLAEEVYRAHVRGVKRVQRATARHSQRS